MSITSQSKREVQLLEAAYQRGEMDATEFQARAARYGIKALQALGSAGSADDAAIKEIQENLPKTNMRKAGFRLQADPALVDYVAGQLRSQGYEVSITTSGNKTYLVFEPEGLLIQGAAGVLAPKAKSEDPDLDGAELIGRVDRGKSFLNDKGERVYPKGDLFEILRPSIGQHLSRVAAKLLVAMAECVHCGKKEGKGRRRFLYLLRMPDGRFGTTGSTCGTHVFGMDPSKLWPKQLIIKNARGLAFKLLSDAEKNAKLAKLQISRRMGRRSLSRALNREKFNLVDLRTWMETEVEKGNLEDGRLNNWLTYLNEQPWELAVGHCFPSKGRKLSVWFQADRSHKSNRGYPGRLTWRGMAMVKAYKLAKGLIGPPKKVEHKPIPRYKGCTCRRCNRSRLKAQRPDVKTGDEITVTVTVQYARHDPCRGQAGYKVMSNDSTGWKFWFHAPVVWGANLKHGQAITVTGYVTGQGSTGGLHFLGSPKLVEKAEAVEKAA